MESPLHHCSCWLCSPGADCNRDLPKRHPTHRIQDRPNISTKNQDFLTMVPKKPFTPGADRNRIWHGGDPILKRLRLKDLHRNGYIDHPSGAFPQIETDNFQARITFSLADPVTGAANDKYNFIHPVFKPENWVQLAPEDYERISPALRLASSFLCEPSVLGFYQAIIRAPQRLHDSDAEALLKRKVYCIGTSPMLRQSLPVVAQIMVRMQHHVKWHFGNGNLTGTAWMVTNYDLNKDGLHPNRRSMSSDVHIRPEFLEVFRQKIHVSQFAKAENFDNAAAYCRTANFFAHGLLHELYHALHSAAVPTMDHPTIPGAKAIVPEPFYRDDRLAELGWAFQQVVFGGGIAPLGWNPITPAAPYGMSALRWPGGIGEPTIGEPRASPARWNETYITEGILDVEWHRKFFTRKFWEVDAARDTSGQVLKIDWTIAIHSNEYVRTAFYPGEPLVPLPPRPGPGVPGGGELRARGFKMKPMKDVDETSIDTDEEQGSGA
ncbi:hypothetical protein BDV97DRAFT_423662 [Delphinella strobiligena]|nr:hypothetical protein BDV97DRAFT_423662 [Delphinella strobiligena]